MAIVTIKFDLNDNQYAISDLSAGSVHDPIGDINYDDLYVLWTFTRGETKPVEFNNLKFGFNLRDMETKKIISSIAYPLVGIQYMRSDAEVLEHTKVVVQNGKQYRLDIWVQNNYKEFKTYAWFNIPTYSDYELDYNQTHDDDYNNFITSTKDDNLDTTIY